MNKSTRIAAVLLLNDTFPNPFGVLAALAAWVLPIVVIVWVGVRLARRREVPWPSPVIAAGLFVGLFVLAILADTRLPAARAIENAIGFIATPFLFPALMLNVPFDFVDPALSHPTAKAAAAGHLALATAGTFFWYLALLGKRLLFVRGPEAKPTAPDERLWL